MGGSSLGCKVDSAKGSTEALGGAKGRGWGGERTAKRVEWLRREMRGGVARARARDYKSERKREPQLQTPRQSQR